ncbi:NAD kinase [Lactobacillus mellis]|uniref:NAD kinase n=1 Tax=Bombilactobacillus mellis TaxID=1218508 RepID=UPI00158091ED|nr:NAD kinase [Bombilactobacillus mellis]MBI0107512.1 NAD kinase [Lactobacillus sp. W8086]MBI0108978.1 NAD kinase [Lactobacillus sp. W8085]MBI0112194.1 NAD kinase [Lactobacillus sp. W8088]MBI0115910.1 NAD kinase [Lactobacillus sp. W8087]MBI0119635.1 NAD kinase [Lactobacillus sp. W8089]MBI0131600.1 NAD kinase [Lactobacillus sp. W8090]
MKVWIQNNTKDISQNVAHKLTNRLLAYGVQFSKDNPDLVVTVGGDGTFLSAFHRFNNQLEHVEFVGIHTGHLGFYTDWQDSEVEELARRIANGKRSVISFPLLEVRVTFKSGVVSHFLSLNESILKRVSQTMRADILIDGRRFERFRGDGVALSTPTGSTAYSKSLGGALVDPSLAVMQFNEIAPINNRVYRTVNSSLILPQKQVLTVMPEPQKDYIITIDNLSYDHCSVQKVEYQISQETIKIASYRPKRFWLRVRNAFLVDDKQ